MFLVTGATGNVGRHVVRGLLDAGERVRAMSRDPTSADLPAAAELVRGDLAEPDGWAAALRDVRAVYLFARGDTAAFLDVARQAGVQRVVTLSSSSVSTIDTHPNPIATMHADVEAAVERSGLQWTHLRPDSFSANTLAWAPGIREHAAVRLAHPDARFPSVHEADIAAVALRALREDGHAGAAYRITGPELISQREQVAAIGAAIGRDIELTEIPHADAVAGMVAAGAPEHLAEAILGHMAASVTDPAPVSDAVTEVTGTAALDYPRWAVDHAADFR